MTRPDPVTARQVDELQAEARFVLSLRKDPARARKLTFDAHALLEEVLATNQERGDLCHRISALFRDLGEAEPCEPLARAAIDLETALDNPRPLILGTRCMFYALFLFKHERFQEASRYATQGLELYERGLAADHPELERVRADVSRILKAAIA